MYKNAKFQTLGLVPIGFC